MEKTENSQKSMHSIINLTLVTWSTAASEYAYNWLSTISHTAQSYADIFIVQSL